MIRIIYILFTLIILTSSCKKVIIEPKFDTETDIVTEVGIDLYGKWVLTSGKMFIEYSETNEQSYYDHFGPNRSISSLRLGGSIFNIEKIERNVTTWEFIESEFEGGFGEFILNNDYSNPYGFNELRDFLTIIEHPTDNVTKMGGSSRPISAIVSNYETQEIIITIQEGTGSIDGYNVTYHSELTFIKL